VGTARKRLKVPDRCLILARYVPIRSCSGRPELSALVSTPRAKIEYTQRKRPRLVFCSYACAAWSTKRKQKLSDIIASLCNQSKQLVNIKFLVQKQENSFSRIRFGRDERGLLLVEWDVNSWKELRPDDLVGGDWNTAKDPLAYPLPGTSPGWETPF
jgi:hypothetical protein